MGNELEQVTTVAATPELDSNLASKSASDIEALIRAEESKPATEPEATPIQPEVVQPEGTETGVVPSTVVTPAAPETPATQPVVPETTTVPVTNEVKTFLEKKHLTEADMPKVVKMYSDLEKEFSRKSQELATLKKAPEIAAQPVVPATSSEIPAAVQEQFLADLQSKPIETFKKFVEITQAPFIANLESKFKSQELHNTVVALSTNPDTAEFNYLVVQDEIKKVLEENPSFTHDMSKNLPIVNDIAIGRLYRTGKLNKDAVAAGMKMAEQARSNPAASVGSATKPVVATAPKPISEMTLAEMEALMATKRWQ